MALVGLAYGLGGRWREAEQLEVQMMETRKRVLGQEHPDTLTSMHNLAYTWKTQGRVTQAVHFMEECIRLRLRILGANHPNTLSSSTTLTDWQTGRSGANTATSTDSSS